MTSNILPNSARLESVVGECSRCPFALEWFLSTANPPGRTTCGTVSTLLRRGSRINTNPVNVMS